MKQMAETGYKISAYWVKPVLATKYATLKKIQSDNNEVVFFQRNAIFCPVSTVFAKKVSCQKWDSNPRPQKLTAT